MTERTNSDSAGTSISVRIELTDTSQSINREALNTYTKGGMFCVYLTDGKVEKYPMANIWRVTEGYGR